jgi:hypothetical protein
MRVIRRLLDALETPIPAPRFSLRTLLRVVLAIGVFLAILRDFFRQSFSSGRMYQPLNWRTGIECIVLIYAPRFRRDVADGKNSADS